MSFFAAFPFLRALFPFLAGIIWAIYLECASGWWAFAAALVFALTVLETFVWKLSANTRLRYTAGILFHLLFFVTGVFLVSVNQQRFYSHHFSHHPDARFFCGKITDPPVEKQKSYKAVVEVTRIKTQGRWVNASGRLLVYIQKSGSYQPFPGDVVLFGTQAKNIDAAKNPGQFDYRQYLYYHNIYQQAYLRTEDLVVVRHSRGLKRLAYTLRQQLIASFEKKGLRGNELAVASALLFGVTDQLEPGLIRAYAGTGALHVLSVSGLHVGIIYGFLRLLLSFLQQQPRGRLLAGIIMLVFIWFYALLTGLTPSVLRSSTMFTFIVAGQMLNRQSSMFNSIAASAFVLLCYDPFLVMEVGFQLSYLAVTGIVVLHPVIVGQLQVKNKWIKPVWSITAVSIAAQMATLPLGLLYFHQFPNYFIFSNLLIIPLSGFILYTGIAASAFYAWPLLQQWLVDLLHFLIYLMNKTVVFIERLPYALIEGISISIAETCLLYAILVAWLAWYKTSDAKLMRLVLIPALAISLLQLGERVAIQRQQKLVVYHVPHHTAIDIIYGRQHVLIADSSFYHDPDQLLFHVRHHWDDLNLDRPRVYYTHRLPGQHSGFCRIKNNLVLFAGTGMYIADEQYNHRTDTIPRVTVLLLCKNARINLEKIQADTQRLLVVADASNTFSRIKKWKTQAQKRHLKFYDISEKGAFVLEAK